MSTSVKLVHAQAVSQCRECKNAGSSHTPCHNCGKFYMSKDKKVMMVNTMNTNQDVVKCNEHGEKASCHCEKCNMPVCLKCVTGRHQGHKMINFEEKLQENKNVLQNDVHALENGIMTLLKRKEDLNSNHEKYEIRIQQIRKEMEAEYQSFQTEIDRCHHEKRKDLASIRDSELAIYLRLSKDIEKKISSYKEKISEYRDAIEKNSYSKIYDITQRRETLQEIGSKTELHEPPEFEPGNLHRIKDNMGKLNASTVSSANAAKKPKERKFCRIMSITLLFAVLVVGLAHMTEQEYLFPFSPVVNLTILTTPTIESEFRSPLKGRPSVFVTKEGDIWLGGNRSSELVKVDIKGQILKKRNIYKYPEALAVMENGDVIMCSSYLEECSIIQFLNDNRELKIVQIDSSVGTGMGVSVTGNQTILICTWNGRVVVMNNDGSFIREIYKGSKFTLVKHAVEGIDGNIYIIDQSKSALMIVKKDGRVLSKISQTIEGHKLRWLEGMEVDTMGNILCADWFRDCIYIIDQNKQMRELVGRSHGIKIPRWLALDNDHNLWITQKDGTIHVVKYLVRLHDSAYIMKKLKEILIYFVKND